MTTRVIPAASEQILPQLENLERWTEWNPWAALDPTQTNTYSDPASGEGA